MPLKWRNEVADNRVIINQIDLLLLLKDIIQDVFDFTKLYSYTSIQTLSDVFDSIK